MRERFNNNFEEIIKNLSGYELRDQQIKMASEINNSLENNKSLMVEGPTGIGKSLGYLIPCVLQNKKIVISTGTITLQEQIINKDLPFVIDNYNKKIKFALAKGRGNYLCLSNFHTVPKRNLPKSYQNTCTKINKEIKKGWNGDKSELDFTVQSSLWGLIKSKTDECSGSNCPYYTECGYQKNKNNVKNADIVVANHALYFTHLKNNSDSIPSHGIVIFDEAHHIRECAINAYTNKIKHNTGSQFIRRVEEILDIKIPLRTTSQLAFSESKIIMYFLNHYKQNKYHSEREYETYKLNLTPELKILIKKHIEILNLLKCKLEESSIPRGSNKSVYFRRVHLRKSFIDSILNQVKQWEELFESDKELSKKRINWLEIDPSKSTFVLNSAPVIISHLLERDLWKSKISILTSATLSVNKNCSYVKKDLGIECGELILDTVFDYEQQSRLFLPRVSITNPNDERYLGEISKIIKRLVNISEGRTLLLFTSFRSMKHVYNSYYDNFKYPTKKQGDEPRKQLLDWFKGINNSVLFATSTFWEGVDIPGSSLSTLIIDRIPFSVPTDPIVETMTTYIKSQNGDWFNDYSLPVATLKLKQGFGRLIRTKNDKGVVCILDPRIITKQYGRTILNSLPKTKIIREFNEVEKFLGE